MNRSNRVEKRSHERRVLSFRQTCNASIRLTLTDLYKTNPFRPVGIVVICYCYCYVNDVPCDVSPALVILWWQWRSFAEMKHAILNYVALGLHGTHMCTCTMWQWLRQKTVLDVWHWRIWLIISPMNVYGCYCLGFHCPWFITLENRSLCPAVIVSPVVTSLPNSQSRLYSTSCLMLWSRKDYWKRGSKTIGTRPLSYQTRPTCNPPRIISIRWLCNNAIQPRDVLHNDSPLGL